MQKTTAARPGIRRLFVLLHRYVGLFLAVFLIIAGITGTVIAFYREFDHALNPDLFDIKERSLPPLNADELADKVKQVLPQALITQLMLDRKRGESVQVYIRPLIDAETRQPYPLAYNHIFIDPYDGHFIGGRKRGEFHADRAHLMPFIYIFHESLYLPERWGYWLMGIVALVWMFDCFVGFYITLPARTLSTASRKNGWQRWAPAWRIKRNASRTRLNFDLHRASGLWLWIVFFMLAFSGVFFNLKNEIFRPALGSVTPLTEDFQKAVPKLPQAKAPLKLSLEEALAAGRKALAPELQYMVPSYVGYLVDAPGILKVRFADPNRGDDNWQFRYENQFLDGQTGELLVRAGFSNGTFGDKVIMWQYPLHSGQVFGFWGRAFIGAVGLITVMLSVTGIFIWIRKRRSEALRRLQNATQNRTDGSAFSLLTTTPVQERHSS